MNDINATAIERIFNYVEADQHVQAEALARDCDFLEECYLWDITFEE